MKIVIVGDGKVGLALTARLSRAGHDVVVIYRDPRVLEESLQTYDVMVVQGNGACRSV
ncbi:NAD-binding protein, partial [Bittarella massiliensis (ex Durand et al. 2017)]